MPNEKIIEILKRSNLKYKLDKRTNRFNLSFDIDREILEDILKIQIKGDSPVPPSNEELKNLILNLQDSMNSMNSRLDKVDSRLDSIENDLQIIKSVPIIKKAFKKLK